MAITQKTVVLNTFGLERRERFSSSGDAMGARYSVSVDATPMVHRFDAKQLGRGPAIAIVEHLRDRVETIGLDAKPATIARREQAKKALAKGGPEAVRRYSGGRIGTMEPAKSTKLFNDSGRFASGIFAAPTTSGWTINFPANRFDPSTFDDGEAGVMRLFVRLRELVPEFGDAAQLSTVLSVRRAIADSTNAIIARSSWRSSGAVDLGDRRRAATIAAVREAIDLVLEIAA